MQLAWVTDLIEWLQEWILISYILSMSYMLLLSNSLIILSNTDEYLISNVMADLSHTNEYNIMFVWHALILVWVTDIDILLVMKS